MGRRLAIHGAGCSVGVGEPLHVFVRIVSEDLRGRPMHEVSLTEGEALKLARQLIQGVEFVREKTKAKA